LHFVLQNFGAFDAIATAARAVANLITSDATSSPGRSGKNVEIDASLKETLHARHRSTWYGRLFSNAPPRPIYHSRPANQVSALCGGTRTAHLPSALYCGHVPAQSYT